MFTKYLIETNDSPAQLCNRVALGIVIFPHGAQKVFGWFGGPGPAKTIQLFAETGFPAWSVMLLMFVECAGSLLLIVGFFSRIWALGLGFAMAVCMFMNHVRNGFFMNWYGNQQGEGFEYHLLLLGLAGALLIGGSGKFSLDRALCKRLVR
ncbi:MAG: DoxX family protein [Deltaproteobacteria bacterium]|nr:DoxX family protein [Deltaproteobacteria bacterium]